MIKIKFTTNWNQRDNEESFYSLQEARLYAIKLVESGQVTSGSIFVNQHILVIGGNCEILDSDIIAIDHLYVDYKDEFTWTVEDEDGDFIDFIQNQEKVNARGK